MTLTSNFGWGVVRRTSKRDERVRQRTVASIAEAMDHGPRAIETRLLELDEEWDAERVLEACAGALSLGGIALSYRDRRWLVLPAVISVFLFEQALRGRSLLGRVLCGLGLRTRQEINHERYALKAARGDFDALDVAGVAGPNTLLTVTEF